MQQKQAIYLLEKVINKQKITRSQFAKWLKENEYPSSKNTITRILQFIDKYYGIVLKAKKSKYANQNYFYVDEKNSDPDYLKHYNFAKSLIINGIFNHSLKERQLLSKYISVSNYTENKGLEFLPVILKAISKHQVLKIVYQSFFREKEQTFQIEPVLLREYLNRWYVISQNIANDKEQPVFALDRIKEIKTIKNNFFKMSKNYSGDYHYTIGASLSGNIEKIILSVSPQQAKYFFTLPFHSSQKLIKKSKNGNYIFSYQLRINYELLQWLKHYGKEIKVLCPKYLQKNLIADLQNTLKQY